jgi:hypothetical protein
MHSLVAGPAASGFALLALRIFDTKSVWVSGIQDNC